LSRSPSEILFRLRQEISNIRLFAFPPGLSDSASSNVRPPLASLPLPADVASRLGKTSFAAECVRQAEEIVAHRFPLLGVTLETGPEIRWRRDYSRGVESPAFYFRRIPYLDTNKAGDHKIIWELNRHQHLVLLAQAHLISRREDFFDEIVRQLESWFEQNPFQRGINWASALEVAFRALSWLWVYHLVGHRFAAPFRQRFLAGLYRHGLHLETNLSFYFSPNTHLLGEAVALHALGALFPHFPQSESWRKTGAGVVRAELDRQVRGDGSHFEQSVYYHVYALDMFLFHAILLPPDDVVRQKLIRMAAFLDAAIGPSGVLPFLGDDDGGRFFHPYGPRSQFGLPTMATCGLLLDRSEWIRDPRYLAEQAAWWIGPGKQVATTLDHPTARSIRFSESGLVVMAQDTVQIIADTGPFGPGSAGHSHADTLSLLVRHGDEQLLIDPGTYTYTAGPKWRNRFRGTAAHNTVRIDRLDQAIPRGPFAWRSRPEVKILAWESCADWDLLSAACAYRSFTHQRDIVFSKADGLIVVLDRVDGPPGEHRVEQFWHFGAAVQELSARCFLVGTAAVAGFDPSADCKLFEGGEYGWISPALGNKSPAPVLCVERLTPLPASMGTLLDLSGKQQAIRFEFHAGHTGVDCFRADTVVSLTWTVKGVQRTATRSGH
jgi:hypothetical protein